MLRLRCGDFERETKRMNSVKTTNEKQKLQQRSTSPQGCKGLFHNAIANVNVFLLGEIDKFGGEWHALGREQSGT